ncbi:MAG: S8 family serine peptidase [Psychroflexus maritimus]
MREIKTIKNLSVFAISGLLLASCGPKLKFDAASIKSDSSLKKNASIEEEQLKHWSSADLLTDTIPGMSVDRAYQEIIRDQKGNKVIVAVVDSGIDNEHEDLASVMWVNPKETENGQDDDGNGYIDDINGWNFLGDIVEENMEYTRIFRDYNQQFDGVERDDVAEEDLKWFDLYTKAKEELKKEKGKANAQKMGYENMIANIKQGRASIANAMGVEKFTKDELKVFSTDSSELRDQKNFLLNFMNNVDEDLDNVIDQIGDAVEYFGGRVDSHFNVDLNARAEKLGDDENDFSVIIYGNNQVSGPDPKKEDAKHGTHVAGIIAADRYNNKGLRGVAHNVEIMSVRAVPDGDEYDKDIANALRYAVDNGAKVINTSFGKYFSPYPEVVEDAIRYADENDVLIVNAAGNDALNLDDARVYPNDQTPENSEEIVTNFLNVGSITPNYGEKMVSSFSNYGKKSVDVFAPGSQIYSSTPLDEYEFLQGTSMAAPAVAGIAALIRSYYPKLSAAQVKEIIMESGLDYNGSVIVGGDTSDKRPFKELSVSGKIANLYNALILAKEY